MIERPDVERPDGCICVEFRDTGRFRIADLACPVHGVEGAGDGYWDVAPDDPAT